MLLLESHHSELFNIFVAADKHRTFSITCPVAIAFATPTWNIRYWLILSSVDLYSIQGKKQYSLLLHAMEADYAHTDEQAWLFQFPRSEHTLTL